MISLRSPRNSILCSLTGALLLSSCFAEHDTSEQRGQEVAERTASASAALSTQLVRSAKKVAGEYIVVLREAELSARNESVNAVATEMTKAVGGQLMYDYSNALKAFAVKVGEEEVKKLLSDPRVEYIEENGQFEAAATQATPPWGLDRVDQSTPQLSKSYTWKSDGRGVHVYVIDSGITPDNSEFANRLGAGYDALTPGATPVDCHGHGTHVSGIIAGTTYGMAKGATVHAVRVLDCKGSSTTASLLAGIDWTKSNIGATPATPAVVNLSVSGPGSTTVDAAIANSIAATIPYVVSAGNASSNSCETTPGRVTPAITVAASDANDVSASFTNFGSCVDLYAPGVTVPSASFRATPGSVLMSGTSMSAAHVAGLVARILEVTPQMTPAALGETIRGSATPGKLLRVPATTPNLMMFATPTL